mgnify:CR=1 FL=1
MSSSEYSAELQPDPTLRLLVLLSGSLLGIVGLVLILGLALPAPAVGLGVALWFNYMLREASALAGEFRHCRGLRVYPDCSLLRLDRESRWRPARLLPGSVVLPRLAWIRFETGRGIRSAELLRGNCRDSDDWRRLQVIWRHVGAAL